MTPPVIGPAAGLRHNGPFGMALASTRRRAERFFRWWIGELKALVPMPIRRALNPSRRLLLIELDDEEAVASLSQGEQRQALGRFQVDATDVLSGSTVLQEVVAARGRVAVPTANNADFFINAIDNLRGSQGLVTLRGRGLAIRPFTVIEEMRAEADNQFRAKEQELLGRIAEMEQTIEGLQREEQTTGVLLTARQQEEIDNFRVEMLDLRKELRDVQRSLREDVESLQREVRLLNIWAVPVLVALLAVILAVVRRARRARYHRTVLH